MHTFPLYALKLQVKSHLITYILSSLDTMIMCTISSSFLHLERNAFSILKMRIIFEAVRNAQGRQGDVYKLPRLVAGDAERYENK